MNKKTILWIIIAIIVIGGIALLVNAKPASTPYNNSTPSVGDEGANTQPTGTTTPIVSSTTKTFTLADIAAHPDATSCYTAIRGNVYDLTAWISEHPGGSNQILKICGKDGSAAFTKVHSGDMQPEKMLATFQIGILQ